MIRIKRHIKQKCITLFVFFFVIKILKTLLGPLVLENDSNTLWVRSEHFPESSVETQKIQIIRTSDFKLGVLKRKVSRPEVNRNPEKTPTISRCGYNSCPTGKPGFLNVHMVPHSHIDLGFLNTYDQYYYGDGGVVGVVKVIDNIIKGLKERPYRKFIFAEMAYFERWWNEQNETGKNVVKKLVGNGQLEFINGGWSMNDEAVTHYVDVIDQMSLGLEFLNKTFQECGRPKVAWQIDSFGHSKEYISLLAQMGFDGTILWRLHGKEIQEREKSKSLDFVWAGSQHLGEEGELFTSALFSSFEPPEYLCLKKDHFNKTWVDLFLDDVKLRAKSYRTTNLIVPVGSDFRMREDFTCFVPTDQLIEHANKLQEKGSKVNLFYSTPSCYLKAVNSYRNVTWPSKTDDMFPYATYGRTPNGWVQDFQTYQEYWTGFYASRPAFKYMVREGSNILQISKQMASYLSMRSEKFAGDISVMKEAMGVMQHHDAITGTSKQFVIDDYIRILHRGSEECRKIQNSFYLKELPKIVSLPKNLFQVTHCKLNMSQCDVTEKSPRVVVNVYNSLSSLLNKYVRIPVLNQAYRVFDPLGKAIPFDIIPIPKFVKTLSGRNSSATHELVFLALNLPPLGSKSYYIEVDSESEIKMEVKTEVNETFIKNQRVMVQLNEKTGFIQSISVDDYKLELEQEFLWYAARKPRDGNIFTGLNSALYKFRTLKPYPFPIQTQNEIAVSIFKGELVQEIHQHYNGYVGQVIRLYMGQDHIELDWVVGPINVEDNLSKEIVSRVTTKLSSNKTFYTDANGRQILMRRVGVHGNLNLTNFTISDSVGGNYYPINTHISIKDETIDKQLTMLVDRAQGGSSLADGQIELMVHRRHAYNRKGGEAKNQDVLNEIAYGVGLTVRGTHLLVLSSISGAARLTRSLAQQMYKRPLISFIPTSLSLQDWAKRFNMETRMLNEELPLNVNLLTFEKRSDVEYLLRVEHLYDVDEDDELSRSVVIDLRNLFLGYSITSAEETMLGGNQFKKNARRLVWKKSDKVQRKNGLEANAVVNIEKIELHPMQIRTFIVTIQKK